LAILQLTLWWSAHCQSTFWCLAILQSTFWWSTIKQSTFWWLAILLSTLWRSADSHLALELSVFEYEMECRKVSRRLNVAVDADVNVACVWLWKFSNVSMQWRFWSLRKQRFSLHFTNVKQVLKRCCVLISFYCADSGTTNAAVRKFNS
jgi:hypothetical protein